MNGWGSDVFQITLPFAQHIRVSADPSEIDFTQSQELLNIIIRFALNELDRPLESLFEIPSPSVVRNRVIDKNRFGQSDPDGPIGSGGKGHMDHT